jgi:succinate dehydrogenase flavin-adding protein (antitoxin of CptAB toxin-antitoxin module)
MGINSVDYDFETRTLTLKPEYKLLADKRARASLVDAITVTTAAGNEFDGNEEAQRRMTSAITAMTDTDLLPWVLHNNTVAMVNKAELTEALRLAGMQMASIWITPYTG